MVGETVHDCNYRAPLSPRQANNDTSDAARYNLLLLAQRNLYIASEQTLEVKSLHLPCSGNSHCHNDIMTTCTITKNNCKSATRSLLLSNQYNILMKGTVGLQLLRVYICLKTRQDIFIRPSPNICLAFEIEMQCVCQVFQWVCIQRKCFNWGSTRGSTRLQESRGPCGPKNLRYVTACLVGRHSNCTNSTLSESPNMIKQQASQIPQSTTTPISLGT